MLLIAQVTATLWEQPIPLAPLDPNLCQTIRENSNAETQLAFGCKVQVSSVPLDILERIPGITPYQAELLTANLDLLKEEHRSCLAKLGATARSVTGSNTPCHCQAFEALPGIGPKRAETLCRQLEPG